MHPMRSRFGFADAALLALGLTLAPACKRAETGGTMLRLEAPAEDADAEVYVDGLYVGQVGSLDAAGTEGLQLAPGMHRLEIRKPGRFPVQRTIAVDRSTPAVTIVKAELLEDPH